MNDYTYSHLSTADGLCNQRIYSIQKTKDGALWWTSKSCVERYNGVQIKHYGKEDGIEIFNLAGSTASLATGYDRLYAFDNTGRIFEYIQEEDRFRMVVNLSEMMKKPVILDDVLIEENGLMLAMREGAYYYSTESGRLHTIKADLYTRTIIRTGLGYLFCTGKGVLGVYKEKICLDDQSFKVDGIVKFNPGIVQRGYYDKEYGTVWLGGYNNGLFVVSQEDKNPEPLEVQGIPNNPIRCFCPLDKDRMLVGVDGFGVYSVDRKTMKASLMFDAHEGPWGVLHGNGIYSVMIDDWGNIVIGSYSGGIDIARPVGSTTAVYKHVRNNLQSIINDHVNAVAQYSADSYLMGTDDGISQYDSRTGQWSHICRGVVVLDTEQTPQGSLLVATYGDGVLEVNKAGKVTRLYNTGNGILKDDHVYNLIYDRDGNLWMGTLGGQLVVKTKTGLRYYPIHNVQDIKPLRDGRMAVATADGVYLVNPQTGKVSELSYDPKNGSDVNRYVLNILIDGDVIYLATDGGGIYVHNMKTGECSQITMEGGLPSNTVCSLVKDRRGRIFIATEKGLAFMDTPNHQHPTPNTQHPTPNTQHPKVIDVNYCYGLNREYIRSAVKVLANGNILYGTTSGAVIVDPEHIQEIDYTARLRVFAPEKLEVSYADRTFDLPFECINLRNQYDIVYTYKVGDGEWSSTSDKQMVRFVNLEPGSHRLTIRAISKTCGAVLDEVEMKIVVAQPWWNSWWMWCIYILALVGAFYGAWKVYELHEKYMRLVAQLTAPNPDPSSAPRSEAAKPVTPVMGKGVDTSSSEVQTKETQDTGTSETTEEGRDFVDKATKYVLENLKDTEFNIDSLCREMGMSRTMFYLKLKSYTGKSPQDFVRIIRLERASAMLKTGRNVNEVAALVGFDNPKYFSTVFKKYFGVSPSKY